MAYDDLDNGTRLASMRTTASFQRTRMSADRTLMSALRTALSMIGFGFTIFSFFRTLAKDKLLGPNVPEHAPALFGIALVVLGISVLSAGILADRRYARELARQREGFLAEGLLRKDDPYPRSYAVIVALLALMVGLVVLATIMLSLVNRPL